MKRFLLVTAIALSTLSASAVNRGNRAPLPREQKSVLLPQSAFKSVVAKDYAAVAVQTAAPKHSMQAFKAPKKAEGDLELIPAYSQWTYHYSSIMGGFIPQIMYDEASFLVADGKAYLQPFANLGVVEGVVEEVPGTLTLSDGSVIHPDSITFSVAQIATYADETDTIDLYLEPCYIENYTPYRLGEKTFGAYYFAEENELYIPSSVTLALFEADETKTDIFEEAFVARSLDLQPQLELKQYISQGTVTGTSYYGESNSYEGDAEIFLGDGFFCVKGCDGANEDAWVEFDITKDDENVAEVFEYQYMGTFGFYNDESRTDTHPGVVTTTGLIQSDGSLTSFAADYDYSSFYSVTDNSDGTTTLANTLNTVYGDYVFEDEEYGTGGMYNAVDLTINITYEPAYDEDGNPVGITSTKMTTKANNATYNMAGQRVDKNFKGLVVKNGRKQIQK